MFEKKNKTRHRVAESDGPIVPTIWPAAGRFTTTWKQLIESDVGPKPVEPRNRMATEPFGAIDSMPKGQRPFSQPKTVINVRMHLYYPRREENDEHTLFCLFVPKTNVPLNEGASIISNT